MGTAPELEPEPNSIPPQLPLTTLPYLKYQQHYSGALTPLHTSASVPFSWEQEPGKPLPCLTLTLQNSHQNIMKCLGLPPRLLNETKMNKSSSPKTVLEGPYNTLGRSILESSSFRFLRKKRKSFDGEISFTGSGGSSPERGLVSNSNVVVSEKNDKGLFGSWRKSTGVNYKGKSEIHGGSFVFPSLTDDGIGSCCDGDAIGKAENVSKKKKQLVLSQPKSHFWATIYGTLKQVIPRRSTKCKKDAL